MVNSSLPHRACEYSRIRKRRERVRSLRFLARRKTCFHMASFGHFLVQICTEPLSNPDAPSRNYCWFAPRWLHLDTILPRSGSSQLRTHARLPKVRPTSVEREHILEHLDRQASSESTFLSIWTDKRRARTHSWAFGNPVWHILDSKMCTEPMPQLDLQKSNTWEHSWLSQRDRGEQNCPKTSVWNICTRKCIFSPWPWFGEQFGF